MSIRGMGLLSLESMAYQDGQLHKDLTEAVRFLRADGTFTTPVVKESGINERINTLTGMMINIIIDAKLGLGAYMLLPLMDKNHPFITEAFREWNTSRESSAWLQGASRIGSVDMKTGRVGGLFSKIPIDIRMGLGLFVDTMFSPEEIASIILHECGHARTYFLHLGTTVVSGLHAGMAAREVMRINDQTERVKVISEAERALGIEIPNKEEISRLGTGQIADGMQMVVISHTAEKQRSETGHRLYELRATEQIADEFAVKHGAGRSLVTALDKLHRIHGDSSSYRNGALHVLIESMKGILFLSALILGGPVLSFSLLAKLLLTNPLARAYDKPEARALLIRQRIVAEMKDQTIDAQKVASLKEDLAAIDACMAGVRDKSTLTELFWENYMSEGKSASKQIAFNKRLEELLYNELFSEAASFRTSRTSS
jgi:hypothetical protein